jgi:sterol desaturase/sphingolipid hydroxylase (fatty acid hydroxylase superfamily)
MIGIPLGLAYVNVGEWLLHRFVLHGLGKRKGSVFDFHYYDHHHAARTNEGRDPGYSRPLLEGYTQRGEAIGLIITGFAHLPLLPIAPLFTGTVIWSLFRYHRVHKRAHVDPDWARAELPWHYDHHMGPNQEANWCVSKPWFDIIMGTREPYVGTERERADIARRARRMSTV